MDADAPHLSVLYPAVHFPGSTFSRRPLMSSVKTLHKILYVPPSTFHLLPRVTHGGGEARRSLSKQNGLFVVSERTSRRSDGRTVGRSVIGSAKALVQPGLELITSDGLFVIKNYILLCRGDTCSGCLTIGRSCLRGRWMSMKRPCRLKWILKATVTFKGPFRCLAIKGCGVCI